MAGLLGYAAAGAAAGLGQSIIERAKAAETRAMEALKREWQLQDRAQERTWNTEDRAQDRAWSLEDQARARSQSVEDRDWERNNTLADRNSAGDAIARAGDPGNWEDVKRGIFHGESGGDYDALYGYSNREGGQFSGVKVTDMTVDEALAFADPSGPYASAVKAQVGRVATPMGAYQVVGTTLAAAKKGLGLTGNERMTPELQDKIGRWIYENQGTDAWEGYQGPRRADLARSARADMTRSGVPLSEQSAILGDVLPEQAAPERPSSVQEYQFAQEQGDTRTYSEWKQDMSKAGATSVTVGGDNMPKAPSGFVQVQNEDGTMGFAPIEGGPGTQISAEIAGRIALADDAIKQLPALIAQAENGDLTGPVDWLRGWAGYGAQGEARRENMAGSEAITRMLTGAGMNLAEAEREKDLYIIGIRDTAETAASKLRQLQRRLEGLVEVARRGREGVTVDPKTGLGVSGQGAPSTPAAGEIAVETLPAEVRSQLSQSAPGQRVQGPDGTTYVWDGKTLKAE